LKFKKRFSAIAEAGSKLKSKITSKLDYMHGADESMTEDEKVK
jgi:hypothetical protein